MHNFSTLPVPDPDDLDALGRGIVREQIAACENALARINELSDLLERHKIADPLDLAGLGDLMGNVRHHRDALQHVLGVAVAIDQRGMGRLLEGADVAFASSRRRA